MTENVNQVDKKHAFISAVFYLLVLLQLLPVWLFPYFPSCDGPSHLLNSYIFVNYERVPVFQQVFTPHIPTAGNLAGHGLVIGLMQLGVSPSVAEKFIISLCLLGLALAFRYALFGILSAHPAASFLVLPFLYNWPLQMGFWSFSLGVPFVLVCIGMCLRYQGRWTFRTLLLLFASAAAVYLCHPLSWAVCGLVVAVMAMAHEWRYLFSKAERKRAILQVLLPVAMFVPFALPNLLFAEQNQLVVWAHLGSIRELLWPAYTSAPIRLFSSDSKAARLLFIVFLLVTLAIIIRSARRRINYVDTLLALSVLLFLIGLFSPGRIGEGTFINIRFLLFGFLVWALWIGLTLPPRALLAFASFTALLACWLVIGRLPEWRIANHALTDISRFGRKIPPNSFICEINLIGPTEYVDYLDHAIDVLAPRNIIDVRDYEAGRNAFWTRFKPGYYLDESYLAQAAQIDFEAALHRFETRTGRKVAFLLLTNLDKPPETSLRRVLPTRSGEYKLVGTTSRTVAMFERLD